MINEHHIDTFDLPSFFHLHDLDMDGFWDKDEIAAVYGLRHHSVIKGKNERPMPEAIENLVVFDVLRKLDTDKDGEYSCVRTGTTWAGLWLHRTKVFFSGRRRLRHSSPLHPHPHRAREMCAGASVSRPTTIFAHAQPQARSRSRSSSPAVSKACPRSTTLATWATTTTRSPSSELIGL